MATILLSDLAPSDAKHFSLGQFEVDVPTETDDARLISEARTHPWLAVEVPEVEAEKVVDRTATLAPQDDPFSAEYTGEVHTFSAPDTTPIHPLAVQAGLDQSAPETAGFTDLTLAAAADSNDEADTPPEDDAAAQEPADTDQPETGEENA